LIAAAVTVVLVQTGLADLDQSQSLINIVADDLIGKAQACKRL
jgi:hypothetical protein